jgi:hypothetical protein
MSVEHLEKTDAWVPIYDVKFRFIGGVAPTTASDSFLSVKLGVCEKPNDGSETVFQNNRTVQNVEFGSNGFPNQRG